MNEDVAFYGKIGNILKASITSKLINFSNSLFHFANYISCAYDYYGCDFHPSISGVHFRIWPQPKPLKLSQTGIHFHIPSHPNSPHSIRPFFFLRTIISLHRCKKPMTMCHESNFPTKNCCWIFQFWPILLFEYLLALPFLSINPFPFIFSRACNLQIGHFT